MLFWNRVNELAGVVAPCKITSNSSVVLFGLTYPWAGNSRRMIDPGVYVLPVLGGIRGVILTALLACEGKLYRALKGTVTSVSEGYHLK